MTSVTEIATTRAKERKRKQNPNLKQPFLLVGQLQQVQQDYSPPSITLSLSESEKFLCTIGVQALASLNRFFLVSSIS